MFHDKQSDLDFYNDLDEEVLDDGYELDKLPDDKPIKFRGDDSYYEEGNGLVEQMERAMDDFEEAEDQEEQELALVASRVCS